MVWKNPERTKPIVPAIETTRTNLKSELLTLNCHSEEGERVRHSEARNKLRHSEARRAEESQHPEILRFAQDDERRRGRSKLRHSEARRAEESTNKQ